MRAATVAGLFALPLVGGTARAYTPDAPFAAEAAKHKAQWQREDGELDRRLEKLRQRFGKRPNIVYVLADDVGWGELGSYLGGKLRGTPTPNLDHIAAEGMKFLSHYSEPSCTPTRLALLTGRLPVRTGVDVVLWPGQPQGLEPEEVTVAEVLSDAGYDTAMFGKWHVGDAERHAPENQGFDYAYYALYNGAIFSWANQDAHYRADTVDGAGYFYSFPGTFAEYREKYGIDILGHLRGIKGKGRTEVKKITSESMVDMEAESIHEIKQYIRDHAKSDRPFFLYWASYAQQMASSPKEYRFKPGVDRVNNQAAQLAQHDDYMRQLVQTLEEAGIEENTLLVWVSDNGPMYGFWPDAGYSWLRGAKGDVYEGGVRTPGIARWPGMIAPGQDPLDLVHVTDLFTTAARIAGATGRIPDDRVTDGIDQTPLLLEGEGHGRRHYMFHYSGNRLAAVRMDNMKLHIRQETAGGLPNMDVYDIMRDPGEKFGTFYPHLWAVTPFQQLIGRHKELMKQYPNRQLPSGLF